MPAYHNLVEMMQNPIYAGAYAFGRRTHRVQVVEGLSVATAHADDILPGPVAYGPVLLATERWLMTGRSECLSRYRDYPIQRTRTDDPNYSAVPMTRFDENKRLILWEQLRRSGSNRLFSGSFWGLPGRRRPSNINKLRHGLTVA